MFSSIRVRLTLWHAAILALVLVLFSVSVYLLIAQRLYGEVDSDLRGVADVIAVSLRHEIEEHHGRAPGEQMFAGVLQTIHATSFPRQAIAVFQGDRLVAAKPGAGGDVRTRAIHAPEGWTTIDGGGVEQRLAMHAVRIAPADTTYRIAVALPLDRSRTQLADVRRVLWIAVPFAVLLAAAAGYLLALTSLAPVAAMTEQVNRITAGKPGERLQVRNPRDELGRLAETFNHLLERLDTAFDQQRHFMADASHELRTPISVARTAAEVTLDSSDRSVEDYREALTVVAAQMSRLTRVVGDMFTLARADAGAHVHVSRPCYINDILEEAMLAARLLGKSKSIEIVGGPFPESPCTGDEDLIRQLVLILLDNAIKYTPDGGRITVELSAGYRITVTDTGIGIPTAMHEKVFHRFYRVDKARSRSSAGQSGGAGLGLSIARWIAELHQGDVRVEWSEPGKGSRFAITLPCGPATR